MSLTIHSKYKYFDSTVQRAEDRRQKFHFCRLPFAVNVMLNLCYYPPVPNIRDKKGNEKKVVKVIAGKDVRLTCQVRENGVTTSWLKNNKTISPSHHPRMRLKLNKYFKIKRVQKDDAGFYTCVAENHCGRNMYTIQLYVEVS